MRPRTWIVPLAALGLAGYAAARWPESVDYGVLPPSIVETADAIRACPVTLEKAIEIARDDVGGRARWAEYDLDAEPAEIVVGMYGAEEAWSVVVSAGSGEIVRRERLTRFPGAAFTGELVTADSGVQHVDIVAGEGSMPKGTGDTVKVHFTGWLNDGTQFVDTTERGEPLQLPMSSLPAGLAEGMQTMQVGGTRKVIVPPALGYGPTGRGNVPGNALLVFDVQLVGLPNYEAIPAPADLPGAPVEGAPTVTDSGLMYYEVAEGDGSMPASPASTVRVHYTGWLNDGTKFDSSRDRGEPAQFKLSQVIAGWTEGVGSMRVGGTRKLVIPYELAYGANGRPPTIPPKATRVFDVELLEVQD